MRFIYIYGDASRDKMFAMGYELIKDNPCCGVSIFKNKDEHLDFEVGDDLEKAGITFMTSNVMTF